MASVIVEALLSDDERNYTLAVRWTGEDMYPQAQGTMDDGFRTAKECIDELNARPEVDPLPELGVWNGRTKPFAAFVGLVAYSAFFLLVKAVIAIAKRSMGTLTVDQ